jgi:hypothetical protein
MAGVVLIAGVVLVVGLLWYVWRRPVSWPAAWGLPGSVTTSSTVRVAHLRSCRPQLTEPSHRTRATAASEAPSTAHRAGLAPMEWTARTGGSVAGRVVDHGMCQLTDRRYRNRCAYIAYHPPSTSVW